MRVFGRTKHRIFYFDIGYFFNLDYFKVIIYI